MIGDVLRTVPDGRGGDRTFSAAATAAARTTRNRAKAVLDEAASQVSCDLYSFYDCNFLEAPSAGDFAPVTSFIAFPWIRINEAWAIVAPVVFYPETSVPDLREKLELAYADLTVGTFLGVSIVPTSDRRNVRLVGLDQSVSYDGTPSKYVIKFNDLFHGFPARES